MDDTDKLKKWNPRYLDYCHAHGKSAEEMMAHDEVKYPGGCMCGFNLWISACKKEFRKQHPEAMLGLDTIHDYATWDLFLNDQAEIQFKSL